MTEVPKVMLCLSCRCRKGTTELIQRKETSSPSARKLAVWGNCKVLQNKVWVCSWAILLTVRIPEGSNLREKRLILAQDCRRRGTLHHSREGIGGGGSSQLWLHVREVTYQWQTVSRKSWLEVELAQKLQAPLLAKNLPAIALCPKGSPDSQNRTSPTGTKSSNTWTSGGVYRNS